jgi:ZIP family zinc transporter
LNNLIDDKNSQLARLQSIANYCIINYENKNIEYRVKERIMDFSLGNILFAFGLTLFAGLSTGIGSALAFFTKQTNKKFLSGALGFSAGVMIYVSFVEIFVKAKDSLTEVYGATKGYWITTLAFFAGIAVIALIDKFVPEAGNPHEMRDVDEMKEVQKGGSGDKALLRMGLFSALAIAIHNFPEGLATFTGALQDPTLGISIAVAIAIHNIPEGIAVSVPVYYATGDKRKAFRLSFLSGLAEPIGALLGFFLLRTIFTDAMFGIIFAGVAGIMVYISLDELLPTAEKYGEHHIAIYGLIAGMVVMSLSLLLFA